MYGTMTDDRRTLGLAPERLLAQRLTALQLANAVRVPRAQLKRDIKAGRVSFRDILLDTPPCARTAKVYDMLMAVPKYGRVKASKTLLVCGISQSKRMVGLSTGQREKLAYLLVRR